MGGFSQGEKHANTITHQNFFNFAFEFAILVAAKVNRTGLQLTASP